MKIIKRNGVPKNYKNDVKQLLEMCNEDFVPKLSARNSSTQSDFDASTEGNSSLDGYFKCICTQVNYFLIENKKVVAFMSCIENYVSSVIQASPNMYISTLIVHHDYRKRGYASRIYEYVIKKNSKKHIYTRTWSENNSHINILLSRNFHEFERIEDDRGPNIDTVYYERRPDKKTKKEILSQYHLYGNILFLAILVSVIIVCFVAWLFAKEGIINELLLALITSLLASAFCLVSDTIVKFRESKNDEYINKLKSFGISNLQFYKDEILESEIPKCKKEIWISGYRLIMTAKNKFIKAIEKACAKNKNLNIRLLLVAPWSDAYRSVYGDDSVEGNYYKVFMCLASAIKKHGTSVEIRFSESPLFNDTYKIDSRFITGPYLHCKNKKGEKIMARDFFSLDVTDKSKRLYKIVYNDYMVPWEVSNKTFNLEKFYSFAENLKYEEFIKEHSLVEFEEQI